MQWRRKNTAEQLKQTVDGMEMGGEDQGEETVGGDPYIIGGNRLIARKKNKKRANVVQRANCDSGEDDYGNLAYLTLMSKHDNRDFTLNDDEDVCSGGDNKHFDHL